LRDILPPPEGFDHGCGSSASGPQGRSTAAINGAAYLATDGGPSGLFLCTVSQDGTLSGCTPQTDPAISRPWGMAIH